MMYSLDEIGILPSSKATDIVSRSECDPLGDLGTYPIFVAPMTSVIDEQIINFLQMSMFFLLFPDVLIIYNLDLMHVIMYGVHLV